MSDSNKKYQVKTMLIKFGFCYESAYNLSYLSDVDFSQKTADEIYQDCVKNGENVNVGSFEYFSPKQDYPTLIKKSDRAFVYYHNSGTVFTDATISLDDNKFPTYSTSLANMNRMKAIYNSLSENEKSRVVIGIRAGILPTRQDFEYSRIVNSLCLVLDGKILYPDPCTTN